MKGAKMRGFVFQTRVDDALTKYFETFDLKTLQFEEIPIVEGLGRTLIEHVKAEVDVPHFDRSAMDGYAVKSEDTFGASTTNPIIFDVVGAVAIGEIPSINVGKQQTVRVATGAPIPKGADSVIMLEFTELIADDRIEIYRPSTPGHNISQRGEDVKVGERVLEKGTVLQPQDIGILAAIGVVRINVMRKLRVAILSTGNELVEPGVKVEIGKTVDTNRFILSSLVKDLGGEPLDLGIVKDDVDEIKSTISKGLMVADMVLVSGGTSVGAGDLVPEVVNMLGKPGIIVHGIAMRPGKPTALAVLDGKPVMLLPGYPVAAMMAFITFVKPIIVQMLRTVVSKTVGQVIKGRMTRRVPSSPGIRDYVRVFVEKTDLNYVVYPIRTRGAGIISSMVKANGLVVIPEEREGIEEGEDVEVILLRSLGD